MPSTGWRFELRARISMDSGEFDPSVSPFCVVFVVVVVGGGGGGGCLVSCMSVCLSV